MADKFQNKYRIPSARASWWNYSFAAAYFITICTHNRQHFFGRIENKQMILNDIGNIARNEWLKTPKFQFAPQSKNLASIVRGYKSSVTTQAKIKGHKDFGWQNRFHDHIIRDAQSFHKISEYIINNPINWSNDKFFK
jgi:putative transposase